MEKRKKALIFTFLFLILVSSLMWFNGLFLESLFKTQSGLLVLELGLVFMLAIFVFSIIAKKIRKELLGFIWVPTVLALIFFMVFLPVIGLSFFFGIWFYAFCFTEASLVAVIREKVKFGMLFFTLASCMPFLLNLLNLQSISPYPNIVLAIQIIFSIMVAYSKKWEKPQKQKTGISLLFMGVLSIIGSIAVLSLGFQNAFGEEKMAVAAFSLLFYVAGAVALNTYLKSKLEKAFCSGNKR